MDGTGSLRSHPPSAASTPAERKKQRNSPERADMLDARGAEQRARATGFTPMYRKPRGHVGK